MRGVLSGKETICMIYIDSLDGYSSVAKSSPKHHTIRVYLIDNQFKTLNYDNSVLVSDFNEMMAQKLGIADHSSFGLFLISSNNTRNERCCKDSDLIYELLMIKRKAKLVYKCKIFKDYLILNADEPSTHLFYLQIRESIVSGTYFAPIGIACNLAAFQMKIEYGAFNPEKHKVGFLRPRIGDFFSPYLLSNNDPVEIEFKVLSIYSGIEQKIQLYLQKSYIIEAMKLSMFGCRFFYARQRSVKTLPEYVWVGIKSTGILLAKVDTREFLREWTFEKIQRWGYSPDAFYFQLKSMADSIHGAMWEFQTSEGEEMMLMLNTYMKYIIDDLDSSMQVIST